MARRAFGDCIGCGQPIAPPYLRFVVKRLEQDPGKEPNGWEWDEVDEAEGDNEELEKA